MSEKREYSENPDIQWALDLLRPDPNYELNIMQKYTSEVICMGTGMATACFRNWMNRRPPLSGLQLHGIFIVAGYIVSQIANHFVDNYKAERDTRLRNYVMLHPEFFPNPVRVKYAEVLDSWTPIR